MLAASCQTRRAYFFRAGRCVSADPADVFAALLEPALRSALEAAVDAFAEVTVSILRTEAGRDPHNKELHDLIGELGTRSEEFRRRWGAHNVRHHGTGFKTFNHPVVGAE